MKRGIYRRLVRVRSMSVDNVLMLVMLLPTGSVLSRPFGDDFSR